MNHGPTRASRISLRLRISVALFALALGAGFFWINYLPQPSRIIWLQRIHAHPIYSAQPIRYLDLKILLSGIECDRAGMNVWVTCPCGAESLGFTNVPFNYPEAALWLGRLAPVPLTVTDGDWLGPLLIVAFLLTVSFLFHGTAFWHAVYFCALIASPPVLLGIERANYDLAMFCLIFLNISLLDRLSNTAGYAAAFGLGMLKIFPIATVVALIKETKTSRITFWLTLAAEATFIFLSFNNLRLVASVTPQKWWQSFGYPMVGLLTQQALSNTPWSANSNINTLAWTTNIGLLTLAVAVVILAYFTPRARQYWLGILSGGDMRYRPLFIAGAAIYSFCFIIGTNFNYRLIFLLFTIPYLFSIQRVDGLQRRAAYLILAMLFCVFWLSVFDWRISINLLRAGITWLLFIVFASVCLRASVDSLFEVRRGLHRPQQPAARPPALPL
jgi:hypothetical protein